MLKFVPDHLKTKQMCKNSVTKLPFVIRYVSGQYKICEIYDKVIIENFGTLMFTASCNKNHKMCDKAVDNYVYV